jgi:hypothetical protein
MTLVVPNASEVILLNVVLGKVAQESLLLKLYSNNLTPAYGTVLGDLTEVAGSGYAAITINPADWAVVSSGASSGPATATTTQRTFTFTGAVTAYGYYLVGATGGGLWWVERFTDGPYILTAVGGQIKVTPQLQGASGAQN